MFLAGEGQLEVMWISGSQVVPRLDGSPFIEARPKSPIRNLLRMGGTGASPVSSVMNTAMSRYGLAGMTSV